MILNFWFFFRLLFFFFFLGGFGGGGWGGVFLVGGVGFLGSNYLRSQPYWCPRPPPNHNVSGVLPFSPTYHPAGLAAAWMSRYEFGLFLVMIRAYPSFFTLIFRFLFPFGSSLPPFFSRTLLTGLRAVTFCRRSEGHFLGQLWMTPSFSPRILRHFCLLPPPPYFFFFTANSHIRTLGTALLSSVFSQNKR